MFKALIVDDNKIARMQLTGMLNQVKGITVAGEIGDAPAAIEELRKSNIDILFLDVEMPGMTGFELLKILPERPLTIMFTAQPRYAVEAFELNVVDFLVKPFSVARVIQSAERAIELLKVKNTSFKQIENNYIFIKDGKAIRKIQMQDILWLEAKGDYVKIATAKNPFIIHATLRSMEEKLSGSDFVRIHRSYIIAVSKIDFIEDGIAHVQGEQLPISENYKNELMKHLRLF
jgi:DNA-binding LytR/AlgR family response regulator